MNEIAGEAADSKRHEAEKAGQAPLSDAERQQLDFSRPGVNVPKARSIKAIAQQEGVDDWTAFADFDLTVDENRELMKRAKREDRGRRSGLDPNSDAAVAQRLAQANNQRRADELDRAKDFALVEGDAEAQGFLRDRGTGGGLFDIGLDREPGRVEGSGDDFARLVERHGQRPERAQAMDERRSAEVTTDPIEWTNNPGMFDFPGIDTVQPAELHDERSERAREADRDELAPIADTRQQWAMHPDEYDWPLVDTPPEAADQFDDTPRLFESEGERLF